VNFVGAWNVVTVYNLGDAVSRNGSSYISIKQPNQGNDPATDSVHWGLLAQKGATGGGITDAAHETAGGTLTSNTGDLVAGSHPSAGNYTITNSSNDLTTCTIVASPNAGGDSRLTASATAAHTITVLTFSNLGAATDTAFSLIVSC
jgi:hypothetical protein